MSAMLAAMTAAMVTGQLNQPYIGTPHSGRSDRERTLVAPPPYPYKIADNVRRPGFNGRLWVSSNTKIGGIESYRYGPTNPGAAYYGADERTNFAIPVRVQHVITTVGPWQRVVTDGSAAQGNLARMERGRVQWLKEHNFIGGTRTFVNQASLHSEVVATNIEPRATIKVPANMIRPRLEVRADEPFTISWPHQTPAETLTVSAEMGTLRTDVQLVSID
jgi:hypothetical protein